jgi:DNA-binding transcriptional ArsR family regulator
MCAAACTFRSRNDLDDSGIVNTSSALESLKALTREHRLALYRLLVQAGSAGTPVGALGARLGLPGATLSNHLNVLRAAGLITTTNAANQQCLNVLRAAGLMRDTREGRVIRCRADYARMDALLAYLTENCCAGDRAACAPVATCAPTPRRKLR